MNEKWICMKHFNQRRNTRQTSTLGSATTPRCSTETRNGSLDCRIIETAAGHLPQVMMSGSWQDVGFPQPSRSDAESVLSSYLRAESRRTYRPSELATLTTDWDD